MAVVEEITMIDLNNNVELILKDILENKEALIDRETKLKGGFTNQIKVRSPKSNTIYFEILLAPDALIFIINEKYYERYDFGNKISKNLLNKILTKMQSEVNSIINYGGKEYIWYLYDRKISSSLILYKPNGKHQFNINKSLLKLFAKKQEIKFEPYVTLSQEIAE